jgi:uncharacterized membrane protein (DUF485 family)
MKRLVWGLVLLLIVLHQDVWFWDSTWLVGGVVPVALAWHMGVSVAAAVTWWLATIYCWPAELEEASQPATEGGPKR